MAALGFGVDILGPFMDGDAIPYAAGTPLEAA
jgi:hypothetical protein